MVNLLTLCMILSSGPGALWHLRAGGDPGPETTRSTMVHTYRYTSGRVPDDPSSLPLETALTIWNGDPGRALVLWKMGGTDLPATRNDLLGAFVWYGRTELVRHIGLGYQPPPDMADSRYPTHSEAVMFLGWMTRLPDGLFHPEFLVGAGDMALLNLAATGHLGRSQIDRAVGSLFP